MGFEVLRRGPILSCRNGSREFVHTVSDFLKNCFVLFMRFVLWLRYDFQWRGLEKIADGGGVLFLPNHPGELDPLFLTARLWRRFKPRAIAVEDFFYMRGVSLLMRWARVIPTLSPEVLAR